MVSSEQWIKWYEQYRGVAYSVFSWMHNKDERIEHGDYATHLAIGTYDESRQASLSTHVWTTAQGVAIRLRRQMIHENGNTSYTETSDENGFSPISLPGVNDCTAAVDARHDVELMGKYLLEHERLLGCCASRADAVVRKHIIEDRSFQDIGDEYGTSRNAICKIYLNAMNYIRLRYKTTEKVNEVRRGLLSGRLTVSVGDLTAANNNNQQNEDNIVT